MKYHSIKWHGSCVATRLTKEVNIRAEISSNGKKIKIVGAGDCEHHLIEDTAILLNKMAEAKCGAGHDRVEIK